MIALTPVIKKYAWGSHTAIQELCGEDSPTPYPIAEYWFGAHEAGSSLCSDGVRLDARIAENPRGELGHRVFTQHGPRLPFLVKLIAAERSLSLQAHPSKQEAVRGFAEEEALGISQTDPCRNYRDDNHKPETVVALSQFEALVGFRSPKDTVDFLEALAAPLMSPYKKRLCSKPNKHGIHEVYDSLISIDRSGLPATIAQVASSATSYLHTRGYQAPWAAEAATVRDLALQHPSDPGVLIALLLNRVSLQSGQAIFLGPGQLHAYLRGTAVEVMANSDNVLRGGLTTKHVDTRELERILNFAPSICPPESVTTIATGELTELQYYSRVDDFSLSRLEVPAGLERHEYRPDGPEILMSTSGTIGVHSFGAATTINPGEALWIPAWAERLELSAKTDATVFRTRAG